MRRNKYRIPIELEGKNSLKSNIVMKQITKPTSNLNLDRRQIKALLSFFQNDWTKSNHFEKKLIFSFTHLIEKNKNRSLKFNLLLNGFKLNWRFYMPHSEIKKFYKTLYKELMHLGIPCFLSSKITLDEMGINKTIFLPIDGTEKDDSEEGNLGLNLLLHPFEGSKTVCLALIFLKKFETEKSIEKISKLLNAENAESPFSGWTYIEEDKALSFRYLLPLNPEKYSESAIIETIIEIREFFLASLERLGEKILPKE